VSQMHCGPRCCTESAVLCIRVRVVQELLAELARSQLEVKRMLGLQKEQAQQLGGLKEQLAAEVRGGTCVLTRGVREWALPKLLLSMKNGGSCCSWHCWERRAC